MTSANYPQAVHICVNNRSGYPCICPTVCTIVRPERRISKEQWQAIQTLARKARDSADMVYKPGRRVEVIQERSYGEARQFGYGGTFDEWRALCRRIMD